MKRIKKKPEYDPEKVMEQFTNCIVDAYGTGTDNNSLARQADMDNRMYSEYAYQSDPEGDEPSADITLDEVGLCKGQKFALHYDFGDEWMFTITVSKISEVQGDFKPRIVKAKGSIQQYPDWDEDEFDEE